MDEIAQFPFRDSFGERYPTPNDRLKRFYADAQAQKPLPPTGLALIQASLRLAVKALRLAQAEMMNPERKKLPVGAAAQLLALIDRAEQSCALGDKLIRATGFTTPPEEQQS